MPNPDRKWCKYSGRASVIRNVGMRQRRYRLVQAGRVAVDHQRIHVDDFSPFIQCHNCLQFGHMKNKCPAVKPACSYCTETSHGANECPLREKQGAPKCANCTAHNAKFGATLDTAHRATSNNCPRLRAMKNRITNRIDYGSN